MGISMRYAFFPDFGHSARQLTVQYTMMVRFREAAHPQKVLLQIEMDARVLADHSDYRREHACAMFILHPKV